MAAVDFRSLRRLVEGRFFTAEEPPRRLLLAPAASSTSSTPSRSTPTASAGVKATVLFVLLPPATSTSASSAPSSRVSREPVPASRGPGEGEGCALRLLRAVGRLPAGRTDLREGPDDRTVE